MPSMKAVQIHQFGGEDVFQYEDVPIPEPGPGEMLIKVHAASVNHSDLFIRQEGNIHIGPQDLPLIIGREAAGVVVEVGSLVEDFVAGQRVVALPAVQTRAAGMPGGKEYTGCYAEYTLARPQDTRPLPDNVDMIVGAAMPWVSLTAWYTLTHAGKLQSGERVLVHSASGGVGVAAIQLAKYLGATVFTTTSTEEKCRRARELGADNVINYVEEDLVAEISRLTDGHGVDLVLESVGGEVYAKSLQALAADGRLVAFGGSGGPVPEPMPQPTEGQVVKRFSITAFMMAEPHAIEQLDDLFGLVQNGRLQVLVDQVFPLTEAAAAHRYIAGRRNFGKVVLTV